MKFIFTLFMSLAVSCAIAQGNDFPFGQIALKHFNQPVLDRDSSATAFILKEFGEAHINNDNKLVFDHHYIIRILKQSGVEEANIEIPIRKQDSKTDVLLSVKAASYNIENNNIQSASLSNKNVFTENRSPYWDLKKFTIPNVRVGSIIEISYSIESPFFVWNFRQWNFQSHLPKAESEYWATIPGNYNYNKSLKGFLKLQKNESSLVKNCFQLAGGGTADCARFKYAMKNIPAFIEEDYMTASSNFISSVNFELLEVKHFDGKIDKVTNEWKDADNEMNRDPNFGGQLKKGKDILQRMEAPLTGITDSLEKAKKVYSFIKNWYDWNEYYGTFSKDGIKKAFESKKGSIGDINLSLIAALRAAGLDVEPLVLSTRSNGTPTELWPVLTDFNYLVAKLNIGSKVFLLDASEHYLSFGMLPERCLNGKGRVFPEKKPSYWYELKPTEKYKSLTMLELTLTPEGNFTGTVQIKSEGYRAFRKRQQIASTNQEEYIQSLAKGMRDATIKNYKVMHIEEPGLSTTETFDIEMAGLDDLNGSILLFNPFLTEKIEKNPFRSNERLYPVDFGAPEDIRIVLNLTYPNTINLESVPDRGAMTLPNSGGKFLFEVTTLENKLTMNYLLTINKTVFNSGEYYALKELFNRIIEAQKEDIVFKKKK